MNTTINRQQWQEEEALRRFQLISPLLQTGLDDAKRIQLRKKIAEENNISVRSLYRYEKAFSERQFTGLKPADREKHRLVLCQEKVQIKYNQFSLCLAKLNLLFLSHFLLDFSDILPHIGLGINTRNGCEYVLYCKMFLCIQKSTYMHVYN